MSFKKELNKQKRLNEWKDLEERKKDPNSIYSRLKAMPYEHARLYFRAKYGYMDLGKRPIKPYRFRHLEKEDD